jgi:DNA-binding Lrp family transcriptional regulator
MQGWSTVKEAAEKIGVTEAYIREILNRAQHDKSIKLKGTKVGKEWKVNSQSINDFLGINVDEESYKKDLYIKELEGKVKNLETKIQAFTQVASSLNNIIAL